MRIILVAVCTFWLTTSGGLSAQNTITVCTDGTCDHTTLAAAIGAASANDIIELESSLTEDQVVIDKPLTLNGMGHTLTSVNTDLNPEGKPINPYGISVTDPDVTIENLTITGANTFGIHSVDGADNLKLMNVTTDNNGGTGIALNCTSGLTLTDITSTNNGGNGVSLTNVQTVTITNITTNGNAFSPGGFGAGVGVFNTSNFCSSETTSGVTIGGVVNIDEVPSFYQQGGGSANAPNDTQLTLGPGSSTAQNLFEVGATVPNSVPTGYPTLDDALTAATGLIAVSSAGTEAVIFVREIGTDNFFTREGMSVQAAIDATSTNPSVISVSAGNYPESINTGTKTVRLEITNN